MKFITIIVVTTIITHAAVGTILKSLNEQQTYNKQTEQALVAFSR